MADWLPPDPETCEIRFNPSFGPSVAYWQYRAPTQMSYGPGDDRWWPASPTESYAIYAWHDLRSHFGV